jgi:hypothetical protein
MSQTPTPTPTNRPTAVPSAFKVSSQINSPSQLPTTLLPTVAPSQLPTFVPSFRPTPIPTLTPTEALLAAVTFNPTNANGLSSINSASNGQTSNSSLSIGVVTGCVIVVIIVVAACIFVARKGSKEKMSPYQRWTTHYSNRGQEMQNQNQNVVTHPPINMREDKDIHHFYNKSPRPSINQNTVFTPHVTGRISSRNSQIVSPFGIQKNSQRLSFSRGPSLHNI